MHFAVYSYGDSNAEWNEWLDYAVVWIFCEVFLMFSDEMFIKIGKSKAF